MSTAWKWRLFLFVPASANTAGNRSAFAQAFANNGSGETLANERKMLDNVVRLSNSGNEPPQGFGVSTLVKASMRDALKVLINGISSVEWYVIHNGGENDEELIQSSRASVDGLIGEPFTFDDAIADLGIKRIISLEI